MTFTEANKIFKAWKNWYYPQHFILDSIFIGKIPESFLPYPQDILREALNAVAKHYHNNGNYQVSKNIQSTMVSLICYVEDKDAFDQAAEIFADPKMRKVIPMYYSRFKKDWFNWLDKQED